MLVWCTVWFNLHFPWYYHLLTAVEIAVLAYCLFHLIKLTIFFTMSSVIVRLVYGGHVEQITGQVAQLSSKEQLKIRLGIPRTILDIFLVDHNRVCYFMSARNLQLFGSVMFVFILTNLPINIYLISRVLLARNHPLEWLLLATIFTAQVTAATVVMAPMAANCKVMHSPTKIIPKLQLLLRGRAWRIYKFKFMDLYVRLSCGPKFGVSVGDLNAITYMQICEVRRGREN